MRIPLFPLYHGYLDEFEHGSIVLLCPIASSACTGKRAWLSSYLLPFGNYETPVNSMRALYNIARAYGESELNHADTLILSYAKFHP